MSLPLLRPPFITRLRPKGATGYSHEGGVKPALRGRSPWKLSQIQIAPAGTKDARAPAISASPLTSRSPTPTTCQTNLTYRSHSFTGPKGQRQPPSSASLFLPASPSQRASHRHPPNRTAPPRPRLRHRRQSDASHSQIHPRPRVLSRWCRTLPCNQRQFPPAIAPPPDHAGGPQL